MSYKTCNKCGMSTCVCKRSLCLGHKLGCRNYMNSSKWCAGPVHLTSEWDIGLRPCCKGAGEKYTAMGGLLNYCSINGGKEYEKISHLTAPYPLTNTTDIGIPIPKNGNTPTPTRENYHQKQRSLPSKLTGIY